MDTATPISRAFEKRLLHTKPVLGAGRDALLVLHSPLAASQGAVLAAERPVVNTLASQGPARGHRREQALYDHPNTRVGIRPETDWEPNSVNAPSFPSLWSYLLGPS